MQTVVHSDLKTVWNRWTDPEHITHWNFASDDWECPSATNDVREGGKFSATMSAKDKSTSFEFGGNYTKVEKGRLLEYVMDDGRKVSVVFEEAEDGVRVVETFEAEKENSQEMQRAGWQSILDNFKKYVEKVAV